MGTHAAQPQHGTYEQGWTPFIVTGANIPGGFIAAFRWKLTWAIPGAPAGRLAGERGERGEASLTEAHRWPEILLFLSGKLLGAGPAGYAMGLQNLITMLKQKVSHYLE